MALSTKTISEFQQQYTSTGYEKISKELNAILKNLGKIKNAQTTLLNPRAGEPAKKGASTVLSDQKKELNLRLQRLKTEQDIDRVQTDLIDNQKKMADIESKNAAAARRSQAERFRLRRAALFTEFQTSNNPEFIRGMIATNAARIGRLQSAGASILASKTVDVERYQRVNNELAKFQRHQDGMIKRLKQIESISKKAFDATFIGKLTHQWQKFLTVFSRVLDALVSFVIINNTVLLIQNFVRDIIASNAELEVMDARLRVLTKEGGAFTRLKNTIIELTVTTPFVIKDFIEASVALQAFGISAEKHLKNVADWAAAIGRPVEDVAVAFAKIATGSPRTALLLSTRGIAKADFDRELRKTGNELEALASLIERRFGGMAVRVADTFKGLLSNIQDLWFILSSVIGQDLFFNLRRDVAVLFDYMKKQIKEPSAAWKVLGIAVNGVYMAIKAAIAAFIGFIALNIGKQVFLIATNFQILGRFITVTTLSLKAMISTTSLLAGAFGLLAASWIDVITQGQRLADTQAEIDAAMGTGSIRAQVDALVARNKALSESLTYLSRLSRAITLSGITGGFTSAMRASGFRRELADNEKLIIQKEKILKQQERENELLSNALDIINAINLKKDLMQRMGAGEWLSTMKEAIKQELATPSLVLDEEEEVAKEEHRRARLQKALEFLQKLSLTEEQLSKMATAAATSQEQLRRNIRTLGADANTEEALMDMAKMLPMLFKHSSKSVKELSDELAEARTRFEELISGTPSDLAKVEGGFARISALLQQRNRLSGGSLVENELNVVKELITAFELLIKRGQRLRDLEEKITDAKIRRLEVSSTLEREQANLNISKLELAYEREGDINFLYAARRAQVYELEQAQTRNSKLIDREGAKLGELKTVRAMLLMQQMLGVNTEEAVLETDADLIKQQTVINQLRLEGVKLEGDIYKAKLEQTKLPSLGFVEGMRKAIIALRQELNGFWDDLAKIVLDGIQDVIKSIVIEGFNLIAGLHDEEELRRQEQIDDLKDQLSQIQADEARQMSNLNQIRRITGETNEQYLMRMRSVEELQNKAAIEYTFRTKELEILEKINELEQERNNIILDRLKSLGEKIFDALLNAAIGKLISGIDIPAPSGGGTPVKDFGNPLAITALPRGGNSYSLVISGPIYGEQDFVNKVDMAFKKIASKRTR